MLPRLLWEIQQTLGLSMLTWLASMWRDSADQECRTPPHAKSIHYPNIKGLETRLDICSYQICKLKHKQSFDTMTHTCHWTLKTEIDCNMHISKCQGGRIGEDNFANTAKKLESTNSF
ncbi:unnamed protein product [Mucor fragilis]